MIPESVRAQIAQDSFVSAGKGIPWQKLFAKKTFSVGYLGGSVTQGFLKDHVQEIAYPALVSDALRKQGYAVRETVCAEAGMGSMHGNLLADETVIAAQPDLVFLEFAINETTLKPSVIAFESLLRKLLEMKNPPIVCLFLLRNANDYSCASFMIPMAEHYGLPYADLRRGINPAIERGGFVWQDYADEESHPNPEGHQLLADCLLYLLNRAREIPETPPASLPEPWLDVPFRNLRYLHPEADCACVETACPVVPRMNPYYPAAWEISKSNGGLQITCACRTLIVFYEQHHLPEYGSCQIAADGVPLRQPVLHGNSIYGWGNAKFAAAVQAKESGMHTVTLTPADGCFYVLGFGICE